MQLLRALPGSIVFNFYYLPFTQAIKLPILCYKLHGQVLRGGVEIDSKTISFGMIRLGFKTTDLYPNTGIMWRNEGKVIFHGECKIGNDSYLVCGKKGIISIGNNFFATGSFRIVSETGINIGDNVLVGWGSIFLDTNFHPLYSTDTKSFKTAYGKVNVGDGCWFAAQTLLLHSVEIPDHCVFGARSIINHSITYQSNCLYSGNPIILLKKGIRLDDIIRTIIYQ